MNLHKSLLIVWCPGPGYFSESPLIFSLHQRPKKLESSWLEDGSCNKDRDTHSQGVWGTGHTQSGSRDKDALLSLLLPPTQSGPCIQDGSSHFFKPLWKHPHTHTQRCMSTVILKPVTLMRKMVRTFPLHTHPASLAP